MNCQVPRICQRKKSSARDDCETHGAFLSGTCSRVHHRDNTKCYYYRLSVSYIYYRFSLMDPVLFQVAHVNVTVTVNGILPFPMLMTEAVF